LSSFLESLSKGVLVADGAIGSMIASHFPQATPSVLAHSLLDANLSHPEIVHGIHLSYIAAGARIIETNTFGASRARLERLGLSEYTETIVSAAVKIAREARDSSGVAVWIGGSISPLDPDWLLVENPSRGDQMQQFEEQASLLLDRGADLLVLETFSRLDELLVAIEAVRRVSTDVPVIAQMSFDEHGELASGETAAAAARRVSGEGRVQVLGVNCSLGPQANLAVLENLAAGTTLPLSIMPNAGFAQRHGGRVFYPDVSDAYYARFTREAVALGARIIGGCCGTTPAQIRAIHAALTELRAHPETVVVAQPERRAELVDEPMLGIPKGKPSGLLTKLRGGTFVRSLQVDPQRGASDAVNREVVDAILERGFVDLVDINSSGASARQDSLQIAAGIERMGLETLAHITPRDASLAGVLSQVLGAYDWGGVRNVLVIAGDPPTGDLYAEAKGIYQVDSIGLVRALDRLRNGGRVREQITLPPFPLAIGIALNQNVPDPEFEVVRLRAKIEAGADFVMTQPFFFAEDWDRYRESLPHWFDLPVLVGVWPLISLRQALRINENVAGVVVPDAVLDRLSDAGPNAREVGFEIAAELIAQLERNGSAGGAYVVAPFKQPKQALDVFERASARS
jgi:homocysteine S-methyltransferase